MTILFGILYILIWVLTASVWYAYDVVRHSKFTANNELPLTVVASVVWPAMWVLLALNFAIVKLGSKLIKFVERWIG